jgi:uncharacterized membrane protein
MQSILLNAAALVVGIVLWIAMMIIALVISQVSEGLAALVSFVLGLLIFVFYIGLLIAVVFCLIKAYQKQYFKLPVIGNFAEKFSTK